MEKHQQALETNRKKIFVNNLIGGIGWAIGSTIGLTIFVTLITFLLSKVDLIPVVGSYLAQLNAFMANHPK